MWERSRGEKVLDFQGLLFHFNLLVLAQSGGYVLIYLLV